MQPTLFTYQIVFTLAVMELYIYEWKQMIRKYRITSSNRACKKSQCGYVCVWELADGFGPGYTLCLEILAGRKKITFTVATADCPFCPFIGEKKTITVQLYVDRDLTVYNLCTGK